MILFPSDPYMNQVVYDPIAGVEWIWNGTAWLSREVGLTDRVPTSQILPAQIITWAVDIYDYPHDLGVVPELIVMWLRCVVPDQGYSVGDLLAFPVMSAVPESPNRAGHNLLVDKDKLTLIVDKNHGLAAYPKTSDINTNNLASGAWEAFFEVFTLKNTYLPLQPTLKRANPADITYAANDTLYSFIHGFNQIPEIVSVFLVCTATDAQYDVGDVIPLSHCVDDDGTTNYGAAIWCDLNKVYVRTDPQGLRVVGKDADSNSPKLLSLNKWKFRVVAYTQPNVVSSGLNDGQYLETQLYDAPDKEFTFLHTLGVKPSFVEVVAECIITEHGFVVGDKLSLNASPVLISGNSYGFQILPSESSVILIVAVNGILTISRTTRAGVVLTPNNWTLNLRVVN